MPTKKAPKLIQSIDDLLIDHPFGNLSLPKWTSLFLSAASHRTQNYMLPFYLFFNYLFITEPPGQGQPTNIPIHALKDWNCQNTIRSEKRKKLFLGRSRKLFSRHK